MSIDSRELGDVLATSENKTAAGIGLCIQALLEASERPPSTPIILMFGKRTMALGRKRMSGMTGRVSLKSAPPEDLQT